jgi:hypothetical protein
MPLPAPAPEWRQGSIIPIQLIHSSKENLTPSPPIEAEGLVILISQDCDIVHPSYEAEPYVEALIARPLLQEQQDGNLFHGKNPRQLQFVLNTASSSRLYIVNVHEKSRIDRKILLAGSPERHAQLDATIIALLARWTAKRYTRAAFPSEFNARCRRAANRIRDRLKTRGDLITGVFLDLNSYEELPAAEDYQVILRVTALPETCEDFQEEQIALSLFAAVERALNECSGIQVVDGSLVAETEITLYDLRLLRRWDYDFLSYRDDDPQGIAPEDS